MGVSGKVILKIGEIKQENKVKKNGNKSKGEQLRRCFTAEKGRSGQLSPKINKNILLLLPALGKFEKAFFLFEIVQKWVKIWSEIT